MHKTIALAASLAVALGAGTASALTLGYTEDFAADVAGWEDAGNAPLTHEPAGGPDGSSFASTQFDYFGFSNPFGGGPVIFRASGNDGASGGAFVGDWLAAGVTQVSAWVYQETGEELTYFLRVATAFNFPGAVFDSPTPVPSGEWTRVTFDIDPDSPLCTGESVTCAEALADVGNLQFGTSAPAALTELDQAFLLGIDQVTIVPEPGSALLLGSALAGLAAHGRRRGRA